MIWIDIKKETPTNTDDILINFLGWDDLCFQTVGYFEMNNFYYDNGDILKTATHWMKLPEDPI